MENNLCLNCKNYIIELKCLAFPEGIPEKILLGENEHSKSLPEQENNIVFEPKNNIVDRFRF
jgi:hypothetical protein